MVPLQKKILCEDVYRFLQTVRTLLVHNRVLQIQNEELLLVTAVYDDGQKNKRNRVVDVFLYSSSS